MREFNIVLGSVRQIQDFVALAMRQPFEVTVGNDHQSLNGKDLMGMLCLDYRCPICVRVQCSAEEFASFRTSAAMLAG